MLSSLLEGRPAYRVGVVGCGNISGVYLENAGRLGVYEVAGVYDTDPAASAEVAARHGVTACGSLAELLDLGIAAVVNLTPPAAHAAVAREAIRAGLHVYNEKPLALDVDEARGLLDAAGSAGVRLGCAPDTFLGAALQLAIGMIGSGEIGRPTAAVGHMIYAGPERWHPAPGMFYRRGAGPLFDMGPYYITALVLIGGPVERVVGSASAVNSPRVSPVGPTAGCPIEVETPTHVSAMLEHASGMISTLVMSFDGGPHHLPELTVFGEGGTMQVPDPNSFSGTVRVHGRDEEPGSWRDAMATGGLAENARGLGVAAMLLAAERGVPEPASGELGLHVLEVMSGILRSSASGSRVEIASRPATPPSWRAFVTSVGGAPAVTDT